MSADWDYGLAAALERCPNRRFGTYWTIRGKVGPVAEKLIGVRGASRIPITDADSFFTDLAEKIQALEDYALLDPVSPRVGLARVKRYLVTPEYRIQLHDFIRAETERVYEAISAPRFSLWENQKSQDDALRRLQAYEGELQTLIAIVACGARWADRDQFEFFKASLKRIADAYPKETGYQVWHASAMYPGLATFYAMGLVAVGCERYEFLGSLFGIKIKTNKSPGGGEPIACVLEPSLVMDMRKQSQVFPSAIDEIAYTGLNNHLFHFLREPLREYFPDEGQYDDAFNWLEYVIGLWYRNHYLTDTELAKIRNSPNPLAASWFLHGPVGRFAWRNHPDGPIKERSTLRAAQAHPIVLWMLQAGWFGNPHSSAAPDRYNVVKLGFDAFVDRWRMEVRIA